MINGDEHVLKPVGELMLRHLKFNKKRADAKPTFLLSIAKRLIAESITEKEKNYQDTCIFDLFRQ